MPRPLVSVVIPTYNRAYCILRTVRSVLDQTYRDVEALVVDDGSSDNTRELIESIGDGRVRYLWQKNAGVSVARNHGFDAGTGEFLALLDSDDVWLPWKLEVQVGVMERHPEIGMTWTDMAAIDPDGRVVATRYLRRMYTSYNWYTPESLFAEHHDLGGLFPHIPDVRGHKYHIGNIYGPMVTGSLVHTSTVLLRRDRLARVGRFNPRFRVGEDYDFHLRTTREGPVGLIDVPSMQYQRGMPDRITRPANGVGLARAYLEVAERELRDHREKVTLSPRMIRTALAEGHRWLGQELIEVGERKEGRAELLRSVRISPSLGTLRLLAKSFVPTTVERIRGGERRT